MTRFRFEEVSAFIEHSETGMKSTWDSYAKKFDAMTSSWSPEDVDEFVDQHYDNIAQLRDSSPQLLRHAHCMMLFGTFESALIELCRVLHRDGKIEAPPRTKLHMGGAEKYLKPHIGGRPAPFADEWMWMHELRIIRNWMAHSSGRVQKDSQPNGDWVAAQRFVRRNRGLIKFSQHGDIVIESGLVDRALGKAHKAFTRIETAAARLY